MNARLLMRARVIWVTGYFLFGMAGYSVLASNTVYMVEGRVQFQSPFVKRTNDITFTVCVSNCSWSITGTASDAKGMSFKQVYDGKVTSSATRFPDEVRNRSTAGNDSTLGIESVDMPDCLPPIGAGPIWLAYASFCKFTSGNTGRLELTWFVSPEFRRDRYTTSASWKANSENPFCHLK